jgi:hypothetical protein
VAGRPTVTSSDAVGVPPVSSEDIPSRVAVLAAAYDGTLASRSRVQTGAILTDHVAGPLVRSSRHILASTRIPLITQRLEASNPGAYDTIDISGVTGTCVPSVDAATVPRDECEAWWLIVDGGEVLTAGITYYESDEGGRIARSGLKKLGTGATLGFPAQGILINLDPPPAALIALAVEIRADLLAHFANAVAHNSADATAAALITSGVPATQAAAITVLNECRLAWASHLANATAHDSKDLVNGLTAVAATTGQTAVTLALELKADINAHLAATYPAAAATLLAATATTVAIQTYTAATLLAAGVTQLNRYPSYLTFTTAGGTPADAPADVVITGTNADTGLADTETVTISQTAGIATATKRFLATGISIAFAAGDGTDATISIGTTAAAHNSADVTNTISAADPSRGTLVAGDIIRAQTFAPYPSVDDLADGFATLAASDLTPGIVLIPGRTPASYGPTITAGLDVMKAAGKPCQAIVQARRATSGESQQQLRDALETEWDDTDKRIHVCSTDALCTITEGSATRAVAKQRFTGFASNFAVRRVVNPFYDTTWKVQPALEGVTLVDSNGALVGHDEPADVETRLQLLYRVPNADLGRPTVPSIDYCLSGEEDRETELRVNLIRDEIERVINAWAWGQVGVLASVTRLTPTSGRLNETKRQDLQRTAAAALSSRPGLAIGIADINAPDLVVIDALVTLSGSVITLAPVVNWTPVAAVGRIESTLSARTGS